MTLSARFHALRDRTLAAVDTFRAEPVRLSFFRNGTVDPVRPARVIEAILKVGGGKETSVSGRDVQSWRTSIVAQKAELHIDRTRHPDLKIAKGDKVRGLARPGQPCWEVLVVEDRSDTRLVLQLGEVA